MTDSDAILWLGGAPCAGKSSVAELLSNRFDLNVYHVDEAFDEHVRRLELRAHPALLRWTTSSWHERWMRAPEVLLADVIDCYREHLSFILSDLRAMDLISRRVLVEGTALLPDQIAPLLRSRERGMWLVPTATFQERSYARRMWVRGILEQCSEPEVAFRNWMGRDGAFARWVAGQVHEQGLTLIQVDGSHGVNQIADMVASHFGLVATK